MVTVGTGKAGDKELRTNWPVEDGLTAGTQKQEGRTKNLVAEETVVSEKDRVGI